MRKYHRWLSVLFGIFILWIAATGFASHVAEIVAEQTSPPTAAAAPPGFVCPESMTCRARPAPGGARSWVGYLHHLHSGEEFGPVGTAISILSSLALVFFAVSGLWMYLRMFRARARMGGNPPRGGRWFW